MITLTYGRYKEDAGFIFFRKNEELNLVREGDAREGVCIPNFLSTLLECISTSKVEKLIEISEKRIKERWIEIENRVKKIHKEVKINTNGRIRDYKIDITSVWQKGLFVNKKSHRRRKYGNI